MASLPTTNGTNAANSSTGSNGVVGSKDTKDLNALNGVNGLNDTKALDSNGLNGSNSLNDTKDLHGLNDTKALDSNGLNGSNSLNGTKDLNGLNDTKALDSNSLNGAKDLNGLNGTKSRDSKGLNDSDASLTGSTDSHKKNRYFALKTNMLFDAALVPNIGAEFYVGKNLSVYGDWMHAWWSRDSRHRYWRIYGGELGLRWWLGKRAHEKPLTGHHVGVYGGAFTFDFQFGDKGYMGGLPGGNILDRCFVNAGAEYGYSLPVSRHLNIDFSIGLGYVSGKYMEFIPDGFEHGNLWQTTKRVGWFGPTKAEISLVWLLGHGNTNIGKGGKR